MFEILIKRPLNATVALMHIYAPRVAKKAEAGQFIILRTDEEGERIPLTVADYDREAGWVGIVYQIVGATTEKLKLWEKKNESLREKMADIRVVNRAKWLLISRLGMTEEDAHYYIEKQAMDTRISRREAAEEIIRAYDT